jgi:hypothetical protein
MFDMLNHDPASTVQHNFDARLSALTVVVNEVCITLYSVIAYHIWQEVNVDEQVNINYGPLPNMKVSCHTWFMLVLRQSVSFLVYALFC